MSLSLSAGGSWPSVLSPMTVAFEAVSESAEDEEETESVSAVEECNGILVKV